MSNSVGNERHPLGHDAPQARRLDRHASWTAQMCAAQRAAESMQRAERRRLDDPYARFFVSHPALRVALAHRLSARVFIAAIDRQSPGLHAFVVLRVRYLDDAIAAATDKGIEQVVLLGAGFDTTILRLRNYPGTIFEVDTTTTQTDKRFAAEDLLSGQPGSKVVWVPCNFERDSLSRLLPSSGFDPARPSLIAWIGVTMFLTREAINSTLSAISTLSAPGSQLVFDYIDADVPTGECRSPGARRVARSVARRGEPYLSGFTPAEVDALVAEYDFSCREHARAPELSRRYEPTRGNGTPSDPWLSIATAQRI